MKIIKAPLPISPSLMRILSLVLAAGIFIYDLMTPLGYTARILYLIPLLLVSQMACPLLVYKAAGLFTLLMVIAFTTNHAAIPILMGIHNHLLGAAVLWTAAYILERKRKAEEALRESEERYRGLFENMNPGFAYCRMLFEDGRPIDFVYLSVNGMFESLTGLKGVAGKRVTEVIPGILESDPELIEIYGRVVQGGGPEKFEVFVKSLNEWFSVSVYCPEREHFAAIFEIITERKLIEEKERKEHHETGFANRILRVFVEQEGEDLFDRVLAIVQEGMASMHGVFGYIAEPGHLICPSLSKMLETCEVGGKCIHYPPEKWKGLWARALKEKRSFYTNMAQPVPPGHPPIRNNLAVPILFKGEAIGLLNLANKDGGYSEEDRRTLDAIGARIAPLLYAWIQRKLREDERKQAEEALRESEERLALAASGTRIGIFDRNLKTGEIVATEQNIRLLGMDLPTTTTTTTTLSQRYTYRDRTERLHPEDLPRVEAEMDRCMAEHAPFESEYRVVWPDGSVHWLANRGLFQYDDQDVPARLIGIVMDITERKQDEEKLNASVAEKENLLRELSHRTKNNMQVISGLLNLQATRSIDSRVINALCEAQDRIQAMALVHEKLYKGGSVYALNIKEYAKDLANNLLKSHQGKKGPVRLELELEEICLPHDMVLPSGLIINELISNSLKHAFPDGKPGAIFLSLRMSGEKLDLRYRDDGPGLPKGFDISHIETLGLKLVRNLAVHQLRGSMELAHHSGTEFVFRFPMQAIKGDSMAPLSH